MREDLRPLERTVITLDDRGLDDSEIAWRLRRTPGFVRRVRALTELRDRVPARSGRSGAGALRPVERRILRNLDEGAGYPEIAARFRRSASWVERVEHFANLKLEP